jgi:hypothetical protein
MYTPRTRPNVTLAAGMLFAAAVVSCAPEDTSPPPAAESSRVPDAPVDASPPAPTPRVGCIEGGSTREEVRAAMGEPDSIAWGDWLYGRSSVTFSYGRVSDFSNAGGELVLCPGA